MSRHAHAAHPKASHHHDKPHHPHWPLAALLFAFVFALGLLSVHETATWLHLASGRWIVEHGAIPATDPFSYTVFGRPWTTDSWLADVLFHLLDKAFGPAGVTALKSAAVAAGFALLLPVNPASPMTAATVLGLGALSAWTGFTERPFVFDILMLGLMIRALRPRKQFKWTMIFHVAAIELLWANLHGTTAVLGVWLIVLKVMKAAMRTEKRERLNYLSLGGVAFLALLCNPHGATIVSHVFTGFEVSATAVQPLSTWFNLQNLFMLAGVAACTVTLQQEFFLTMTAASLIALGWLIPEMRPLSVLGVCPAISLAFGHLVSKKLDDTPERVAKWAAVATAAAALHAALVWAPLADASGYPVMPMRGAVEYLRSHGASERLFNEPGAGGMLAASGVKVFVDERRALYGEPFLKDAERWPTGLLQLSEIFKFDHAVVFNRRAGYPARLLDEEPSWSLAYADDAALVYAHKAGPKRLLKPNELWPDSLEAAIEKPATRAKAQAELDAWVVQAPDAVQPLLWKARLFDASGRRAEADAQLALARERRALARQPELLACLAYVLERRGDAMGARRAYGAARMLARRRGERELVSELEKRFTAL